MWMITTRESDGEVMYLGWQNPGWNEEGYFWTFKKVIKKLIATGHNTAEHPFVFDSKGQAIAHLKKISIPQKCTIIKI